MDSILLDEAVGVAPYQTNRHRDRDGGQSRRALACWLMYPFQAISHQLSALSVRTPLADG